MTSDSMIPLLIIILIMGLDVSVENSLSSTKEKPIIEDDSLMAELVFNSTEINGISNMAFLPSGDILILDRTEGSVYRIANGTMIPSPLVDVNISDPDGLLGIATSIKNKSHTDVFLYYTQAPEGYEADVKYLDTVQKELVNNTFGYIRECNCLYRYKLENNELINPTLVLNLPARPGGDLHHGGEIAIGPDGNVYVVIGNLEGKDELHTKAQNFENGLEPDGRAGILRVTQDGKPVGEGILGNEYPLNLYYAYGIRNSFGIDFDPVTGNLWDTENGPEYGDEINLVEPGFNSGSDEIYGIRPSGDKFDPSLLSNFDGRGKYSDPELTWAYPIAPTAIKFLNSSKLGIEYLNDMFVADVNSGSIYHFDLNEDRTQLLLEGSLEDKVVDNPEELNLIVFARFGGGVTDLQVGPDGYLYVLVGKDDRALIYRIIPKTDYRNEEPFRYNGDVFPSRSKTDGDTDFPKEWFWINEAPNVQEVTTESRSLPGSNNILQVIIERSNTTSWGTLSTAFIPITGYTPYNYELNISARDVNHLYSKVYYYYSNKTEIKGDLVFQEMNGTFNNKFTNTLITPSYASYAKLQIWATPNTEKNSSYTLTHAEGKACRFNIIYQEPIC